MSADNRELFESIIYLVGFIVSYYLLARFIEIRWPSRMRIRFGNYRRIPISAVILFVVWLFVYQYFVNVMRRWLA